MTLLFTLAAAALTATAPPADVPPELTDFAQGIFEEQVAAHDVFHEAPTSVACESVYGVYGGDGDATLAGTITVDTTCYGIVGGGVVWFGTLIQVGAQMNVVLSAFSIDPSVELVVETVAI